MAHTRNATLRLSEDDEGLRVEADLDPRTAAGLAIVLAPQRNLETAAIYENRQ